MLEASLYDPPPNKRRPMPKYSILMCINEPDQARLAAAIASLVQQSVTDWELILVGTQEALSLIGPLTDSRIRTALGEPNELLPYATNRLLPTLGTWVGFLGQDDRLVSDALTQLDLAMVVAPAARVMFTDEESRNGFGQISMRFNKGAINPLRLRNQEYLRDLVVIERAMLSTMGGFNRLTSSSPTHDLYLRVLDTQGPSAFCHVPHRLYQRFRDHRDPLPRLGHDQQAAQDHLARRSAPALVRQLDHRLHIEYRYQDHPWVTAVVVVEDDLAAGLRRIKRSQVGPLYRPATFQVLHVGVSPEAEAAYRTLCAELRLPYQLSYQSVPAALNQVLRTVDTELLLILQGEAVHPRWLHRLVDHVRIPGTGAVGPRICAGSRLHQPGILGHQYDGWDWNTAGRFDVMAVPHQIAAVSPACLLIDTRRLLAVGSFNPTYPTLYGMDLCLRLDTDGFANLMVPTSRVEVQETSVPVAEATVFRADWPGWVDRFRLHQLT